MDKNNKLITLKSGKKYLMIENCVYKGENYYFANEIINDELSDIFNIFKINTDKDKEKLEKITNSDIIKGICEILDKKIN